MQPITGVSYHRQGGCTGVQPNAVYLGIAASESWRLEGLLLTGAEGTRSDPNLYPQIGIES